MAKMKKLINGEWRETSNNFPLKVGKIYALQNKVVIPTESRQIVSCDNDFDGLGDVTVEAVSSVYVGSDIIRKSGKTITPTTAEQTVVPNGVYTTGAIKVEGSPNLLPENIKDGVDIFGKIGTLVSLPVGFTNIATGEYTLSSNIAGGSTFDVEHNLGAVPDMFIFYHEGNIATTYSMLMAMRCNTFNWRSSSYLNKCYYHGNSTTTATGTDVTTSYGITTLTETQATITTFSTSTSYYWRSGTYKWIAIKF